MPRREVTPGTGVEEPNRRIVAAMVELRRRGRLTGRARLRRLRTYLVLAVQAGVAAALAWTVSKQIINTPEPVFAPATAVATVGTSIDRRLRRTIELIIGVTIGVGVGDLLIAVIGTGPWQTGVIVTLAIIVAILLKGSGSMVNQAGGTAVLIAALSPTNPDLELPRFFNAAIGGVVGLIVVLLLLPLNPLRLVERRARPVLDRLARQLDETASALTERDARRAESALRQLTGDEGLSQLREAVQAAREVVTYSPVRWRRRGSLAQYKSGLGHLERAYRDSRGLIRRVASMIRDDEPVPDELPAAVREVARSIRLLHLEISEGREPEQARVCAVRAVTLVGQAQAGGPGFQGSAAVAQLRTIAHDLLRATGLSRVDVRSLVRHAFTG